LVVTPIRSRSSAVRQREETTMSLAQLYVGETVLAERNRQIAADLDVARAAAEGVAKRRFGPATLAGVRGTIGTGLIELGTRLRATPIPCVVAGVDTVVSGPGHGG
jgi:hypothetical protein